jgi:putative Ca2+/H+ antiporter (TMEM165/GDT1 family)
LGSLLAALGLVFVAELGDKTQLVALGLGARHRLAPVLAGVALAYAAATTLSAAAGGLLGAALPARAMALLGGVLFLAFAAWTLRDTEHPDGAPSTAGRQSLLVSVTLAMFVAELGDKTMLATAALAGQGNPVATWIGATIGLTASGAIAVVAGGVIGARLPERALRLAAALLFAGFGIALLVANG